jgi:hypothetical protein
MNAPFKKTAYLAHDGAAQASLAEVNAAEIRERIAEFDQKIHAKDGEIDQLNGLLHGSWRANSKSAAEIEAAAADLERLHRVRRILQTQREGAQADLEITERQIAADRVLAVRAEFDALMTERSAKARQLVAFLAGGAELFANIDMLGERARSLFFVAASQIGIDQVALGKIFNPATGETLQADVEAIWAHLLPKDVWLTDRGIFGTLDAWGRRGGNENRLIDRCERQRTEVLALADAAVTRITGAGASTSSNQPDQHAESLAEAQKRAAAAAA